MSTFDSLYIIYDYISTFDSLYIIYDYISTFDSLYIIYDYMSTFDRFRLILETIFLPLHYCEILCVEVWGVLGTSFMLVYYACMLH